MSLPGAVADSLGPACRFTGFAQRTLPRWAASTNSNSASNVAAGPAGYGYSPASVIVAANLMALLVQCLFAKVGVATDLNMPELCRQHCRGRPPTALRAQAAGRTGAEAVGRIGLSIV